MNTHDHDFEAIAALVTEGGTLDPVAHACGACRSEFTTQTQIRSMLMATPQPEMSGPERATLRSGVNTALGSDRRLNRWVAVGAVAAGLLVVVGIGPMLTPRQMADETTALEAPTTTEASIAEDTARAAASEAAAPVAGANVADQDEFSEIRDGGVVTAEELEILEDGMRDSLEPSALKFGPALYSDRERAVPPCLPTEMVFGSVETELNGRGTVSYLVEDENGLRVIDRYDAATCELLVRR